MKKSVNNYIRTYRFCILVFCILISAAALYLYQNSAVDVLSKYGSRGEEVRQIQTKLKSLGYEIGTVDGVYGSRTQYVVSVFQRHNGITADGIAGQKTLDKLGIKTAGATSPTSGTASANQNDINLLARIINAEARGEVYSGQVAVGAVVLNRMKHPSFPNSISGVIYQPGAFSALQDGQFNAAIYSTCYNAARDALNGWDPTGGCIYYYNPKKTSNAWMLSRPVSTTIGNHVFTK